MVLLLDIVLVAIEKFLDRVSSQQEETFLNGLFALRHFIDVRICQRWSRLWNKWSWQAFLDQSLPIDVFEPYVILDLLWAIEAKSIRWFSLQ